MPRINLLPWRTELRQRRKKDFLVALAGSIIVALGTVYLSKLTVQGWTSAQQGRNQILRGEIAELDKQIQEITGLDNQRDRLVARMRVITQLQRSRPEVVHLFDELVNAIPEGVHLLEVAQRGLREDLLHEPRPAMRHQLALAPRHHPRGFLAAVLQGVEAEVAQAGGVGSVDDPEHSAFVLEFLSAHAHSWLPGGRGRAEADASASTDRGRARR